MNKKFISVYGCGGTGINVVRKLSLENQKGFGQVTPYLIDTSLSNLRDSEINQENTHIFENKDGSGKTRGMNSDAISREIPMILNGFEPQNFNIVIHSASGGSGSVIGPLLAAEIINRGKCVVVIMVGSSDSEIEVDNCIKTLKTYEYMAANTVQNPIAIHYLQNGNNVKRKDVDSNAVWAVIALQALFSGENAELDSADLSNWLKYPSLQHQVVSLHFAHDAEGYTKAGQVVSVATLAKRDEDTSPPIRPAYQAVGFVPEDAEILKDGLMHYTISTDLAGQVMKALEEDASAVKTVLTNMVPRASLLGKNDKPSSNGLIL